MQVPLVLFSGGMDSTYLVSYMLSVDGPIDVLYVNGGQSTKKMELELKARDQLIEFMNRVYPNKIQRQYEILHAVYLHDGQNKKWIQPNAWMQGAFRVLDASRHTCVRLAYVKDDGAHFGMHLQDIKDQWASMLKVGFQGDHIPLEFPLLHMTKLEIMEQIDKRLLPMVWVCEIPRSGKACQRCAPCTLANTTLWQYKQRYGETVWRAVKRAIKQESEQDIIEELRTEQRNAERAYVKITFPNYDYYSCLQANCSEATLIQSIDDA